MKEINKQVKSKNNFRLIVEEFYTTLVTLKKEKDQKNFNKELLKFIPVINGYVANRLKMAVLNGTLNKNMFRPNDFTDQLFIDVYDHLDEISNESELHTFLFEKVDQALEDSLIEEEFDHLFFDNIDTYTKPEWDAMEEKYSRDGGGDFVLLEELDDSTLNKNNYTLDHVFITNEEKDLAKMLDANLNKERIERHIKLVLNKMSVPMRTVFQLYADQGFTTMEIAKIRKTTLKEVAKLLVEARQILKDSFAKRFLIDSN